jgi:hypothetical protein
MLQNIFAFHKNNDNDWVAELACQHFQHVRHKPPFINRPWVMSESGRDSMLGTTLDCKKCDRNEPIDQT